MTMTNTTWYHGGDFIDGKAKGTYLYVTEFQKLAEAHAHEKKPNGALYRLRPEYCHLVKDHPGRRRIKVILQTHLQELGGALSVFEKIK